MPEAQERTVNDDILTPKTVKDLVNSLLIYVSKMWTTSFQSAEEILGDFGIYNLLDSIAKQLAKHPFLAFGISACILSIALPFILFMAFSIVTVIMTFTGFVIVEGTLITIASVLLFGFLGSVLLISLFFGSFLLTGYFGFMHIYDMFCPTSKQQRAIRYYVDNRNHRNHVNG